MLLLLRHLSQRITFRSKVTEWQLITQWGVYTMVCVYHIVCWSVVPLIELSENVDVVLRLQSRCRALHGFIFRPMGYRHRRSSSSVNVWPFESELTGPPPPQIHICPPRKTCHASHLSPGHWSTNKHRGISAARQQNGHIHTAGRARDTGREGERLSQRLLVLTHRAFYWLNKRDRINQRDIDSSWRASPACRLKLMTSLSLQLIVRVCECVRWQMWTSAGTSIPASYMLSSGSDSVLMLQPDSAADRRSWRFFDLWWGDSNW